MWLTSLVYQILWSQKSLSHGQLFLLVKCQYLIHWPSRDQVKSCLPKCFKNYPKTRVIIDCTEFQVEKSKTPTARIQTWSEYKQRNTLKCLVGISPSGASSRIHVERAIERLKNFSFLQKVIPLKV